MTNASSGNSRDVERSHNELMQQHARNRRIDEERHYNALMRARTRDEGLNRQHSSLRVYGLLKSAIRLGVLEPEQKLSEPDLVRCYAASRNAVREALSLLAAEGLVTRGPRHGTVVHGSISSLSLEDGTVWRRALHVRSATTGEGVPADADFAPAGSEQLDLKVVRSVSETVPTSALLRERLQTSDTHARMSEYVLAFQDRPFELHTAYARIGYPRRELQIEAAGPTGLAMSFELAYGSALQRVESSIEAVACDQRTSKMLDLPAGFPMLWRERLLVGVNPEHREYSFTAYVRRHIALQSSVVVTPVC